MGQQDQCFWKLCGLNQLQNHAASPTVVMDPAWEQKGGDEEMKRRR